MKRRELTREETQDAERLNSAWNAYKANHKGATQTWLAAEAGLGTQGAVGQYLRGKIPLNTDALIAICKVIEVDPAGISPRLTKPLYDLAFINKDGTATFIEFKAHANERRKVVPRPDVIELRVFDISASMGPGKTLTDYANVVERISVSAHWLRSNVKFSTPENLGLITAYGDSMEPTFRDGDVLLVDRGVGDVKIDAVYVLALHDDLYIKRLQRRPDGQILMKSDNKNYDPYVIKDGDIDQFRVLGRVLMAWNAVRL